MTILIVFNLIIVIAAIGFNWLFLNYPQHGWFYKKCLHIIAISICAIVPFYQFHKFGLLLILAFAEIILLYLVVFKNLFISDTGQKSWGICLFPIPYALLLYNYYEEPWIIFICMFLLAISDGMASIVGILFPYKTYNLTGDKKSIVGSLTFFVSSYLILFFSFQYFHLYAFPFSLFSLWIVIIAAVLTLTEALGSKGWDNFLIPLVALLFIKGILNGLPFEPVFLVFIIGIVFVLASVKFKLLNLSGAITAALLGCWIVYTQTAILLLPLFAFFGSSAIIGKVFKTKVAASYNQGNPRDHWQVLSNGGSYLLLSIASLWFINYTLWPILFLISMAVATADTWSSEIGIYFNKKTINIITLKTSTKGISGGVSWPGTLAALIAAMLIAALGFLIIDACTVFQFAIITSFGFGGMLLDSILGALFQARYKNKNGEIAEYQSHGYILEKGFSFFNNNAVNLWSNVLLVLLAWWVLGWNL